MMGRVVLIRVSNGPSCVESVIKIITIIIIIVLLIFVITEQHVNHPTALR